MKIAVFHELPAGGARRAINEFCKELKKRHIVDLYVTETVRKDEKLFFTSINSVKFREKKWSGNNWKVRIYKDSIELIKLAFLQRRVAKVIDEKGYDIVLVSASRYIEAPFIMRFLKTPFVYYIHDPNYRLVYDNLLSIDTNLDFIRYNYERLNRFVRKWIDKSNVSCAKICLSPSKYIAAIFKKTYGKDNYVIRYGVDSKLFHPSSIKKEFDLLYIGSSHPIDGYDFLEQSLSNLKIKPSIRLLMTDKEWISDDKKLRHLYQASKIMVCPARKEGLGLAVVEAMACGIPVVAVDEAGHKETVINNQTGYLVKRDPQQFANKIKYLLADDDKRHKFGINAFLEVEKNWSWEKQAKELEKILIKYLGRNDNFK